MGVHAVGVRSTEEGGPEAEVPADAHSLDKSEDLVGVVENVTSVLGGDSAGNVVFLEVSTGGGEDGENGEDEESLHLLIVYKRD